jgi:hypothetical protein
LTISFVASSIQQKSRLGDPDDPLTPNELRKLQRINETAPADVRAQFANANAPAVN